MSNPRRRRHSALRWMALALGLLLFAAGFFRWSNHSLQIERFTCPLPGLPEGFDGFTIVHLSDLHTATFGEGNRDLLLAVAEAEPHIIVLTGDLLDQSKEVPEGYVDTLARGLSAIAPTYFVTGNHEWARHEVKALKAQLTEAGVTVLSNEALALALGEDRIVLAGIDDPNGYAGQKTPEELAEEIHNTAGDPFWILLAHRNTHFAGEYSLLGADLVLSGHGHGGLIRLPFTDGLVSTDRSLFPSYTAGFYEANGATLFVSRGLGNTSKSFRLFNRPEVAVLTLRTQ